MTSPLLPLRRATMVGSTALHSGAGSTMLVKAWRQSSSVTWVAAAAGPECPGWPPAHPLMARARHGLVALSGTSDSWLAITVAPCSPARCTASAHEIAGLSHQNAFALQRRWSTWRSAQPSGLWLWPNQYSTGPAMQRPAPVCCCCF